MSGNKPLISQRGNHRRVVVCISVTPTAEASGDACGPQGRGMNLREQDSLLKLLVRGSLFQRQEQISMYFANCNQIFANSEYFSWRADSCWLLLLNNTHDLSLRVIYLEPAK